MVMRPGACRGKLSVAGIDAFGRLSASDEFNLRGIENTIAVDDKCNQGQQL